MINSAILVVYLLCLALVFWKMIEEICQGVAVKLDQDFLQQQLQSQGLEEKMTVAFKFPSVYRRQPLETLPLQLKNQSSRQVIYLHWQYSTFTDPEGRSHRLINTLAGGTFDLFQAQTFTVLSAGQSFQGVLFLEDCLNRDPETNALTPSQPIFNWQDLQDIYQNQDRFSLQLVFQMTEPIYQSPQIPLQYLQCQFTLQSVSWQDVVFDINNKQ